MGKSVFKFCIELVMLMLAPVSGKSALKTGGDRFSFAPFETGTPPPVGVATSGTFIEVDTQRGQPRGTARLKCFAH